MRFIRTYDHNWLNLNIVDGITSYLDGDKRLCYMLRDKDGNARGQCDAQDIEAIESELVPAAHGVFVTILSVDPIEEDEVYMERQPVCAWRVHNLIAEPVLAETIGTSSVVLIELPDGMYCRPGVANYRDLDDAMKHFKELKDKET